MHDSTILRQIGSLLKATCPPQTAFALFVGGPAGGYLSNVERGDVADSVREWLDRMGTKLGRALGRPSCGALNRGGTPCDLIAQASLVTICAIIGDGIEQSWRAGTKREPLSCFFLYEVGGPGKLTAWRANGQPGAVVHMLESWLFRLDGVTSLGGES